MPPAALRWAAHENPNAHPPESRIRQPCPVRVHLRPARTAVVPPARLFGSCASLIGAVSPATDRRRRRRAGWHHPLPRGNCARSRSWRCQLARARSAALLPGHARIPRRSARRSDPPLASCMRHRACGLIRWADPFHHQTRHARVPRQAQLRCSCAPGLHEESRSDCG
eukprot:scaffold98915_cov67-Phaeocystis_antarctica.AAC.3